MMSVQSQSRPTLCDPMDSSMPGFPVHHQLPELAQTQVYQVSDAIQPSHPLLASLLLPSIFPSIRVFSNELALRIRWSNYWSFSFSITPFSGFNHFLIFPHCNSALFVRKPEVVSIPCHATISCDN